MIEPARAAVRPRVVFADAPDAVLLEDEVRTRLEDRRWGILEVTGTLGGGKTTALAHLAAIFVDEPRLRLFDVPDDRSQWDNLGRVEKDTVVVVGIRADLKTVPGGTRCRLATWGLDDWIEYLMARHRDQLSTVIARVQASRTARLLLGNAELWSEALDEMAADPDLSEPEEALRRRLVTSLRAAGALRFARALAFARRCGSSDAEIQLAERRLDGLPIGETSRLLRHGFVLDLLAADHALELLRGSTPHTVLARPLMRSVILSLGRDIRGDEHVIQALKKSLTGVLYHTHATSASLLHAAAVEFVPDNEGKLSLDGAQLAGVRWPGLRAHALKISYADLSRADLSEARIVDLYADQATLRGVRLTAARVKKWIAKSAALNDADLSYLRADVSTFETAILHGANLTGAWLPRAAFISADLRNAQFVRADLTRAVFTNARFDGTNFSGANLVRANLASLDLRSASFDGAILRETNLARSHLEGIEIHGADLEGAWLRFTHLTGSSLPAARMAGASLFGAYLAHVDWERADLRDVDFTGASFHMGSSRSGLVGSPIACEGSRTGFYTDDYNDQDFKPPEEIRKANLRGCDLRGAKIDGVDFYLVDLREARYTPYQRAIFENCGAILETRV